MRIEQAVALLSRTQLLADLDQETLARLADRAIERSYRKGQLVFHQGDLGNSLFVIVEGLVKVFVTSEEGDEMVLVTLRSPETFGELALIDGGERSASAETLEPTSLLSLTRGTLIDLMSRHPGLTETLLRSLGGVVRRLTEQASDLVFLDLHGRVAKLLLALAEERGERRGDETLLDLHMTQSDLAGMVGGSRQSVNQILRSFERRGYLEFHGRQVVVKRPEVLRRRASL
ncbi:MAG: Crp/Fnr family transcriptional regulator [Actinomycetota bacterium]